MTKVRGTLLTLIFIFLMVEIVIISPKEIGVSSRSDSPLLSQPETQQAQQSMRGVHLSESKSGSRDWELWADQAFTTEGGAIWKLLNVKVQFFGDGGVTYVVTGETGDVNVNTKDVRISGNVVMISSNGYRFRTQQLYYVSQARALKTGDPVAMNGGEGKGEFPLELKGVGMLANLGTNEIKILENVKSKRQLESKDFVFIESNTAEFSSANRIAKYLGDVTIDYQGSRITGPSARFDYDPTIKAVSSLLVEGGARVTDLSKWATAKTIQMLFKENKFILKGSPRVVQDNDELVGDEITFLDGGKEILVNRAKAEMQPRAIEK